VAVGHHEGGRRHQGSRHRHIDELVALVDPRLGVQVVDVRVALENKVLVWLEDRERIPVHGSSR